MNYEHLCIESCEVVQEVAEFIRDEWSKLSWNDVETKGIHNFVTYIDKKSEAMLVDKLSKLLPGSVFYTEEETVEREEGHLKWFIDPLDGTTNYIHRLSPVAISVALYDENQPLLAIIYEIRLQECFYTWHKAKGSFLNNRSISVSFRNHLKDSLIATGFPYYDYSRLKGMHDSLDYFFKNSHGVRRLGSAATDLAYVACGRFEAFYEYGLQPWDVAAGAFIVQNAGGRVSDFSGNHNYIFGKEIVATNELVYSEFLTCIQQFFVKK